jgi:hypothetical protein
VFFWAKRMMQPRFALLAAVLTLAMPSMAYSGHVMTENAFLLFFMLAAWAIAVAVERPTILNQVLVVLAVAVAFGTRAQAVVLLAALPLIIVLHVLAEERASGAFSIRGCGRRFLRFWPLAAIAGLGVLAILVRTLATDWQVSQLLQAYSATTAGQYTVENVSRYFLWHLGEATFALGVIPVAALLLLVGMGILNRTRSSAERAYLCTALVVSPLVILQVAVFTSYWSERVSERNMFCVFPIVLIGLALWFDLGLVRTKRTTALAAAIAGSLIFCVPFVYLYGRSPSTETWALVLPEILTRKFSGGANDVQIFIVVGVAFALLVFGILRLRIAIFAIPLILIGFFAITQIASVHAVSKAAAAYRHVPAGSADASWIDQSVPADADVEILVGSSFGADADRIFLWQADFFNKHPFTVATWGTDVVANPVTGAVSNADGSAAVLAPYVLTPSSYRLAGTVVAKRGAFLIIQPQTPYQLLSGSSGILTDDWTAPTAAINYYVSTDIRTIRVQIDRTGIPASVPPTKATVTVGTLVADDQGAATIGKTTGSTIVEISSAAGADFELAVPPAPFRVQLAFEPSFRPSDYGQEDTRDLGAHVLVTLGSELISR